MYRVVVPPIECVGDLRGWRPSALSLLAPRVVKALGALLGLATHTGLGGEGLISFPGCEYFASSIGALLALLLWCVALRLFLAPPKPAA